MSLHFSLILATACLTVATFLVTNIVTTPMVSAQNTASKKTYSDTILILDASGSMWGQIEGVNKIVIAKDVVEGLVRTLPDEQRLGFVAYGHRKKGDCSDIQTLAEVGSDKEAVIKALQALSPKGKTPLSKSVEHAALKLDYKKAAATIILVSDGLETCDVDPCALAKTLEENGLDFTVHVVGFDVTEKEHHGLQCIATETGGQYLTASDAAELSDPLMEVALNGSNEPSDGGGQPVPSKLSLKATILSGGPLIQSDLTWQLFSAGSDSPIFTTQNGGSALTEVLPGDYIAKAQWHGWRKGKEGGGAVKNGQLEFTVKAQQTKVVTVPIDLAIPVTLEVPESTPEGVPFEVTWTGPDNLGAYVNVNRLDDGPRDVIYGVTAQKARQQFEKQHGDSDTLDTSGDGTFDHQDKATALIGGPSVAGQYEVRYVLDQPRLILARKTITVADSEYMVKVQSQAPVSHRVEIHWTGPLTDGDFVTLISAGSTSVFERGYTARLKTGETATLTTPPTPGDYEVRYILANGYTLYGGMQQVVQARAPVKVVDVEATLDGPEGAVGGSTIEVNWSMTGDAKKDDIISVIEKGANKYNRLSTAKLYSRGEVSNPTSIRVPAIEGDYEIAYVLNPGARIVSRRPLMISRAVAALEAPSSIKANEEIVVNYSGDGFSGDRVLLVPEDTADSGMWGWGANYGFFASKDKSDGTIASRLTAKPGKYELRYVTGMQHQVLTRMPIEILP